MPVDPPHPPPTSSSVPASVPVPGPAGADGGQSIRRPGAPMPSAPWSLFPFSRQFQRSAGGHALLPSPLAPGSSQADSRLAELGPDARSLRAAGRSCRSLSQGQLAWGRGLVDMTPKAPGAQEEGCSSHQTSQLGIHLQLPRKSLLGVKAVSPDGQS